MNYEYKGDISIGRSYNEQYKFHEATYSEIEWKTIDMLQVMSMWQEHTLELRADLEYCMDLEEDLAKELFALIFMNGTDQQIQVSKMIINGLTQQEIARKLGINSQSNIHKVLMGNIDYSTNETKKYGGLANKLTKLLHKSRPIQKIMKEIHKTDSSCYLPFYSTFQRTFKNYNEFTKWLGVRL